MAWALHMVSFKNFVKSMPPSLSELKVIPSLCFPFKIPDDPTATNIYIYIYAVSIPGQNGSAYILMSNKHDDNCQKSYFLEIMRLYLRE